MTRQRAACILLVVFALVSLACSGGGNASQSTSQSTAASGVWSTVASLKGNGSSKTAPFHVAASQWKVDWSCDPQTYGSEYNLAATLEQPGLPSSGDLVVNVVCKAGDASTTKGETMEYSSGTFYLDVTSESSWSFVISAEH